MAASDFLEMASVMNSQEPIGIPWLLSSVSFFSQVLTVCMKVIAKYLLLRKFLSGDA